VRLRLLALLLKAKVLLVFYTGGEIFRSLEGYGRDPMTCKTF
jgi:hypothetical protein